MSCDERDLVAAAMTAINTAWLENRPGDLAPLFDPSIVMTAPGFAGRLEGREAMVAGFQDFCRNARVVRFEDADVQIDVIGPVAVATYTFVVVYEQAGGTYESTGRDFWIFRNDAGRWIAVWRTMLDVTERTVE
jgi:ketosteroid isomerase-like protein